MSRTGRKPIEVPKGVDIKLDSNNVMTVKGSKGTLTTELHKEMEIKIEEGTILVNRPSESKKHKSLHGLTRTLINNMVVGVTEGYQKNLEIHGVGYRAQKQGNKITFNLGYSHPVEMEEIPGITLEVPAPTKIQVKGIDKQLVGEIAAKIREKRKPDAYKGKGIRYENEVIKLKEGKTGGKK